MSSVQAPKFRCLDSHGIWGAYPRVLTTEQCQTSSRDVSEAKPVTTSIGLIVCRPLMGAFSQKFYLNLPALHLSWKLHGAKTLKHKNLPSPRRRSLR